MVLLMEMLLVGCNFFFFNDTATTEIYTLSLHDALLILLFLFVVVAVVAYGWFQWYCRFYQGRRCSDRSEEHTSELQSLTNLVCRLLLERKNSGNLRVVC